MLQTMTGRYPRKINYKTKGDLKKESAAFLSFKVTFKDNLSKIVDKEERIQFILEAFSWALPSSDLPELISFIKNTLMDEVSEPPIIYQDWTAKVTDKYGWYNDKPYYDEMSCARYQKDWQLWHEKDKYSYCQ